MDPLWTPFAPNFGGRSSPTSPLKIWDVMPHYLNTSFWARNRKLIIVTIFAWTTPLNMTLSCNMTLQLKRRSLVCWRTLSPTKMLASAFGRLVVSHQQLLEYDLTSCFNMTLRLQYYYQQQYNSPASISPTNC